MLLRSIDASILSIPFKAAFRHASAERSSTQTIWVTATARDGAVGYGEGCPREYVTAESLESAQQFTAAHRQSWTESIRDTQSLAEWVRVHQREIDANPAAWTAVELALLDVLGKVEARSVEALLGLPPLHGRFRYTAVVGDAPAAQFGAQLARYQQAGFRAFKVKLSGDRERDDAKARALEAHGISSRAVRGDANNVWHEAQVAIDAIKAMDFAFFALEEPLRVRDYEGMRKIASALGSRIVLDESVTRREDLAALAGSPDGWLLNVRVSKMGGLLRALELLREAQQRGLRIIIGAHVGETSVLTRAALIAASFVGENLVGQEGAFGTHLLERDVAEPPLMFGAGGILDADALDIGKRPGLGLNLAKAA